MAFSILIVFYLSQKDIWKYIVFVMCIQRDGSQKWKVAQPIKGSLSRGESWHPLNNVLLCVKYWPLCGAQEGGEGTHHTHTHTHTHTARLSRATQINCFQAARPFWFYWDQNIIQGAVLSRRAMLTPALCELSVFIRHVQFFTITITYLLLRVVKHSINVPNENSVLCF